ncbi:hypothetical protein [Streptomyces sp. NPDC004783]|uniref:hypothetical protein n=1 Tax=Streptomyces sp. NPDC004783 TaxID=3154459 RepID=UPI0033BF524C
MAGTGRQRGRHGDGRRDDRQPPGAGPALLWTHARSLLLDLPPLADHARFLT